MTRRATVLALALLAVTVGVVTAARVRGQDGRQDTMGTADGMATGSATRLGPHDGEMVTGYLTRSRAALAGSSARSGYALVALDRYLTPAQVPTVTGAVTMVRVLVRVPLPRVQTEIVEMPARTPADIEGGMSAAAARLDTGAEDADSVSAAVDRAQAGQLRHRCACVLAIVVRADHGALAALADRPGIRTVEPAPPGEPLVRLAFAPLLPEQRVRVEPPPDDGAVALAHLSPRVPPDPPSESRSESPEPGGRR
ncbi:MAG TPA: hypothetical protein VIS06_21425 [Mycobacteriales bacterium]